MQLHREEIYEKIWVKPMGQVAAEYGLSDNGLRKVCRKLNIPWPPRGYWQKLQYNKRIKKPALPTLAAVTRVEIRAKEKKPEPSAEPQEILVEYLPENRIRVAERLERPHEMVAALKGGLRDSWRFHGLMTSVRGQFDVRIGPESVNRAMRILDALIKALETRGMAVVLNDDGRKTQVRCFDKFVQINLYEKVKMKEKTGNSSAFGADRYEYIPTGELVLQLDKTSYGPKCHDGKKRKLEDCLNEVVIKIYREAFRQKAWDMERERSRREEEERQRLAEERRRQQELEQKKIYALEQEAVNWQKGQLIRVYIDAKRENYIKKQGAILVGSEFESWLVWATTHADKLDPIGAV